MQVCLQVTPSLTEALLERDIEEAAPGAPLVFQASGETDWDRAREELALMFRLSKAAAVERKSVVYIVGLDALLGRAGAAPAMTAAGLVSASRTLALELRKGGSRANTLVTVSDSSAATVARWVAQLLESDPAGPSGEVIHLGGAQIGKALS